MESIRETVKDAVDGGKMYELLTGRDGLSIPVVDALKKHTIITRNHCKPRQQVSGTR